MLTGSSSRSFSLPLLADLARRRLLCRCLRELKVAWVYYYRNWRLRSLFYWYGVSSWSNHPTRQEEIGVILKSHSPNYSSHKTPRFELSTPKTGSELGAIGLLLLAFYVKNDNASVQGSNERGNHNLTQQRLFGWSTKPIKAWRER